MLRAAVAAVGRLDEAGNLIIDRAELAAALRGYGPAESLSGTLACDGTGDCLLSPTGVFEVVMAPSNRSAPSTRSRNGLPISARH